MKKYFHILFYFLFTVTSCYGQVTVIDSLDSLVDKISEDTSKVNAYNGYFLDYEFVDIHIAEQCLNKSEALGRKVDFKKGLATTHLYLGFLAQDKGDAQLALKYFQNSISYSSAINDKRNEAKA